MKCPNCESRKISVEEAPGYTSNESPIKECSDCGIVWRVVPEGDGTTKIDVIVEATRKAVNA